MEEFTKRAIRRKQHFQSFKAIIILKMMKAAKKTSELIIKKQGATILQRVNIMNRLDTRLRLCDAFVKQFRLAKGIMNQNVQQRKQLRRILTIGMSKKTKQPAKETEIAETPSPPVTETHDNKKQSKSILKAFSIKKQVQSA